MRFLSFDKLIYILIAARTHKFGRQGTGDGDYEDDYGGSDFSYGGFGGYQGGADADDTAYDYGGMYDYTVEYFALPMFVVSCALIDKLSSDKNSIY